MTASTFRTMRTMLPGIVLAAAACANPDRAPDTMQDADYALTADTALLQIGAPVRDVGFRWPRSFLLHVRSGQIRSVNEKTPHVLAVRSRWAVTNATEEYPRLAVYRLR